MIHSPYAICREVLFTGLFHYKLSIQIMSGLLSINVSNDGLTTVLIIMNHTGSANLLDIHTLPP